MQALKDIWLKHQNEFIYMRFWLIVTIVVLALYFIAKFVYVKIKKSKGEEVTKDAFFDLVYSKRYIIAAVLLFVLTVLQLSGSSIGMWAMYIPNELESSGELVGQSQQIRSDEWATFTPFALSQKYNGYGYFSDIVRGTKTDVYIEYGTPVLNIGIIFRLFQIGYLIFGQSMGLAFYWNARFLAILLATMELLMLITNKNKKLSMFGSMLIAFSPVIAWWFSINGLIEMIVSMELATVLLDKYLKYLDKSKETASWKKLLCLIGIFICAGTFIFTFYPSWQVPFAYVTLALIIWVFASNIKNIRFQKIDIIQIAIVMIVFIIIVAYLLINSLDTIASIMGTDYPGSRVVTGGGMEKKLFQAPTNMFFNINQEGMLENTCESALIFDLFPLGLVFALYVFIKEKKADLLLILCLTLDVIFTLWCLIGFPEILAKLTLLSFSQANRTIIIFEFVNILVLLRSLTLIEKDFGIIVSFFVSLVFSVISTWLTIKDFDYYLWLYMRVIIFIVNFVLVYGLFRFKNKIPSTIVLVITLLMCIASSLIVNPIRKGVGVIYDLPITQSIEKIAQNDDGLWIMEGIDYPTTDFSIMAGAKTLNVTNVYPNKEVWSKIDKEGKYSTVYNRYAHIKMNIVEDETSFELAYVDSIVVNVNVNDLDDLGVKYVITHNDLSNFNSDSIEFNKLDEQNTFSIYEIKYK